jgi:hypothetical protein
MLRRFWFSFAPNSELPIGVRAGCGVTAFDLSDAQRILSKCVFGGDVPPAHAVIEDVDVSTLDPGHVLPNMVSPNSRGVWFPQGYGASHLSLLRELK